MKQDPVKIRLQNMPEFHQLKSPEVFEQVCILCCWRERHGLSWGTQEQAVPPLCREGGNQHPSSGNALYGLHPGDSHTASNSVATNGQPCLEYNHFYIHKGAKLPQGSSHSHYPDSLEMFLHPVSWTKFPVAGSWCLPGHATDKVQLMGCFCKLTVLDMGDQFLQFLLEI